MKNHTTIPQAIAEQSLILAQARQDLPQEVWNFFAHMRIETEGRIRDLLLGPVTHTGANVSVLDWQRSPLAEVFFLFQEGEEYEVEHDKRILKGKLRQKNVLAVRANKLVQMTSPRSIWSLDTNHTWRQEPNQLAQQLDVIDNPRSTDVQLDDIQLKATRLDTQHPLLVLGEAGCGKTTVALHRLAYLKQHWGQKKQQFRAVVIVPTEGLRRLSRMLLRQMGVEDVEVWLYDRWAAMQARRTFHGIPAKESSDVKAGVIRFKRHPALRAVLSRMRLRGKKTTRADLHHLFGDKAFLEQVARASQGDLSPGMLEDVWEHTRIQFSSRTEQAYAHVDADRLTALDGREIDDGTPMHDAGSIDVEDYAVLFELERLRGYSRYYRPKMPRKYDCIVLDEAQEFAQLELSLIARSLSKYGSLVIAGDSGQQLDPSVYFRGWSSSLRALRAQDARRIKLETSYRCPERVTELSRRILQRESQAENLQPSNPLGFERIGPVAFFGLSSQCHLVLWLVDALTDLLGRDPKANVAIICRNRRNARALERVVRRSVGVHLALDGDFQFGPGISITCVEEVRGLEFDRVIICDASAANYPDTAESRRALYLACTRASHQLVVTTVSTWSPILTANEK